MRIGINASFLRKPGTGIGQATLHFLKTLSTLPLGQEHATILYLDEPVGTYDWPKNFEQKTFLPFWKRDDVPRQWLWERKVAKVAQRDGCEAFVSLYQSASVFPKHVRHVMVVHDLIPFLLAEYRNTLSRRLSLRGTAAGIRRATHLVSVSQSTKSDLVRFGIPSERISVAYEGVGSEFETPPDPAAVHQMLEKFRLAPGYIYHGGGLEKRKNTEGVLKAYALLVGKEAKGDRGVTPPLVISGRIFPESNTLATPVRSLVRELGLEERVILTDYVSPEELKSLYQGARLFVYPSLYEGFGLPILEAMTLGVPVVTSNTSSLPEIGQDAVLTVDPAKPAEIAGAMEKLLADDSLRESLISKSRKQALQFSWLSFTQHILSVLLPRV